MLNQHEQYSVSTTIIRPNAIQLLNHATSPINQPRQIVTLAVRMKRSMQAIMTINPLNDCSLRNHGARKQVVILFIASSNARLSILHVR